MGSKVDWLFQDFIARLWRATHIWGGKLTANCKSNVGTGTMFTALELLKPLLPRGFLRNVPQAQTISNIVKTERAGRGRRAPRSERPSAADRARWDPSDIVRIEEPMAPVRTKGAPK
jgi:hypothetical protein